MKKLALALVCLVSVAFFASCEKPVENPQPTIQVLQQEGYLQNGDVIDLSADTLYFGFTMASNNQTNKELAKLTVNVETFDAENASIESTNWANVALTGTSYTYTDGIILNTRDIIGRAVITAIVTDAAGETATATIQVSLNEAAQPLIARTFEWARRGSNLQGDTQSEMAAVGLQWVARDAFHANIRPLSNCTLYVIENNLEAFEGVATDVDKAACFANLKETATSVDEYRNISVAVTGDKTYNDILAIIDAEGNTHLVLIGVANVQTGNYGVHTTITGQMK